MSHYNNIHLEDKSIDTAILHAGVNDLQNDNSQTNVDNLTSNIHKIIEKSKRVTWNQKYFCVQFGVYYTGKPNHIGKSS